MRFGILMVLLLGCTPAPVRYDMTDGCPEGWFYSPDEPSRCIISYGEQDEHSPTTVTFGKGRTQQCMSRPRQAQVTCDTKTQKGIKPNIVIVE